MLSSNKIRTPKLEINHNKKIRKTHNNQKATLHSPLTNTTKHILVFNNATVLHY